MCSLAGAREEAGGVLLISSVGDQNILGFEIFDPGYFCIGKFGKYFFGWLD